MVDIVKRKVRTNGFAMPLHPTQLLTYLIYFGDLITYYAIDMASLSHRPFLISFLGLIYGVLAVIVFIYGYLATASDPTDPTIRLERECREKGVNFDKNMYEYHCSICESHVLAGSKHCGRCNRCSSGFDHHCMYLNNCVGEENYDLFFKVIIYAFWMCFMHNLTNGFIIYYLLTDNESVLSQHEQIYSRDMSQEFLIALAVVFTLNIAGLVFLIDLIKFHIELKMKGLTTYEFLKLKDQVSRESKIVIKVNQELKEEKLRELGDVQRIKLEQDRLRIMIANEVKKKENARLAEESRKIAQLHISRREEVETEQQIRIRNHFVPKLQDLEYEEGDDTNKEQVTPGEQKLDTERGYNEGGPAEQQKDPDFKNFENEMSPTLTRKSSLQFPKTVKQVQPSLCYILSKLFPCFSFCKSRTSQVVQENNQQNSDQDVKKTVEVCDSKQLTDGSIKGNKRDLDEDKVVMEKQGTEQSQKGLLAHSASLDSQVQSPQLGFKGAKQVASPLIRKAPSTSNSPSKVRLKAEPTLNKSLMKAKSVSAQNVTIEFGQQLEHQPIEIRRSGIENIDGESQGSDANIKDIITSQINQVKLSSELNNPIGTGSKSTLGIREKQMEIILKLGTGGDMQEHVTDPASIVPEGGVRKTSNHQINLRGASHFTQRAASANLSTMNQHELEQLKRAQVNQKTLQNSPALTSQPVNQFQTYSQTLKRIKSELETIQENKKEDPYEHERRDTLMGEASQHGGMENIMVDESYSFSLRQFGKQASKKDLGGGYFDHQSRMSNMSGYAQGDSSNRGGNTALNTEKRRGSSKLVQKSHDFIPFSKTRRGARDNRLSKNSSRARQESAYLKTQTYDQVENIDLQDKGKVLGTNLNDSASELDRQSQISYNNHRPQSNRFTSYNHNSLLQSATAPPKGPSNNLGEESVIINSDRGSLRIIEVSQDLPSVSTPIAQSQIQMGGQPGAPAATVHGGNIVEYSNGDGIKPQISKQQTVAQHQAWKMTSPSSAQIVKQDPPSGPNSAGRSRGTSPRTNIYGRGQMQSISSNHPLVQQFQMPEIAESICDEENDQ